MKVSKSKTRKVLNRIVDKVLAYKPKRKDRRTDAKDREIPALRKDPERT